MSATWPDVAMVFVILGTLFGFLGWLVWFIDRPRGSR